MILFVTSTCPLICGWQIHVFLCFTPCSNRNLVSLNPTNCVPLSDIRILRISNPWLYGPWRIESRLPKWCFQSLRFGSFGHVVYGDHHILEVSLRFRDWSHNFYFSYCERNGDKINEGRPGAFRDTLLYSWHWRYILTYGLQSFAIFGQ